MVRMIISISRHRDVPPTFCSSHFLTNFHAGIYVYVKSSRHLISWNLEFFILEIICISVTFAPIYTPLRLSLFVYIILTHIIIFLLRPRGHLYFRLIYRVCISDNNVHDYKCASGFIDCDFRAIIIGLYSRIVRLYDLWDWCNILTVFIIFTPCPWIARTTQRPRVWKLCPKRSLVSTKT